MNKAGYYNTIEAAAILGVTKWTIIRWCNYGRFHGAFLPRRSRRLGWQIPRESVEALLEEEERHATAQSLLA